MTEVKYNKLVTRIFWFALPLVIGLLTWLVVNTFAVKEQTAVIAERNNATLQMQEKIYKMASDNNRILLEKADKIENENAHHVMFQKLDELNGKVDIITRRQIKYLGLMNAIPYKEPPMVSTDTLKKNDLTFLEKIK